MAKSNKMEHQEDVRPSAPPSHLNESSIHQQDIIYQPPQTGFQNGSQQQQGSTNTSFQSVVVQPPPVFHPTQYELPETYCRKLYTNRRQTGSISGGKLLAT